VKKDNLAAKLVGLMIAWGGPALLLSPAGRLLGPPERLTTMFLQQLALWASLGIILTIVLAWEKLSLGSLGLRPLGWPSFAWGLLLAVVMIAVVMPALSWALGAAGIPGFEPGMAKILVLPVWFRLVAVVTAGIVEDTLFLGYAFNRLALLIGSRRFAGSVTVIVVSVLHFPTWGLGPVLAYVVAVGVTTGFFMWRRDLLANIVAHVAVDGMALVIVPGLSGVR
jgi:membrane protease YdiL (CAAX protease family)